MEELTLTVIENLKQAETKEEMLDIVTQKLQKLVKKFEDRLFTSLRPAQEYKRDKDAKDEITFIKEGLLGNWNTLAHERFHLIKQQVEEAISVPR